LTFKEKKQHANNNVGKKGAFKVLLLKIRFFIDKI